MKRAAREMNMDRREFCKNMTTGLAGIIAAGTAPSLYALGANDRIRVACVGYSDRFRQTLFPGFLKQRQSLNVDIVAVADLWKKRLHEQAKPGIEKAGGHPIEAYSSDVELYEKAKDVDAVIISTADFQHAQHAVHAVNAGKDVYCEKPIAEDMYSANLLLDTVTAKRNAGFGPGSVVQIGTQRRSSPAYAAAKDFVATREFGDLVYVDLAWNVKDSRRWRKDASLVASMKKDDVDWNMWLLDRDPNAYAFDPRKYLEFRLFWPFSSGIPGQWLCHAIDLANWYTGNFPLSAVASGGLYAWNDGRQSFDTYTTVFEYGPSKLNEKGFQVVFSSRQTNGVRGCVEKYYSANGTVDLIKGTWSNEGTYKAPVSRPLSRNHQKVKTAANTGVDPITCAHIRNWLTCIRERRDPVAPVEAGYAHAVSLIMSNAACRTGMKASYDSKLRQVVVGGKPWIGYSSITKSDLS